MIEVRSLNKTYDRHRANANHVLRDISFTLPNTGFVCILGPSGCGKTSLLNALGGLDVFDSGAIITEDVQVTRYGTSAYEHERNKNFGYIFQNYYLLEDHSVAYNVYLGLHSLALDHREKMKRVRMALRAVDMERYIHRTVRELSGGQQQRIAIARALARRPKVIFADEPTGNLDEANTRNICSLLRKASKESLVIMVTHEEHIARFYADRIITLERGQVSTDSDEWNRGSLSATSDKILYAGDYHEDTAKTDSVTLRLLGQADAPPVALTVVTLNDRIVIKLDDPRPVTLSASDDAVRIEEGTRPVLTLENVDQEDGSNIDLFSEAPAQECRAGKGITWKMMLQEAHSLMHGKGIQRAGLRVFLVLLTVLALLITADYIAVSKLDPEDFSTADSHILEIFMGRGNNTDTTQVNYGSYGAYWEMISTLMTAQGAQFEVLPTLPSSVECTTSLFYQMQDETIKFPACSKVNIAHLDPTTLIYGRMPETSNEIVVDRQVLEAVLAQETTVAKSINRVDFFLGVELTIGKRAYAPTIVGICDSGDRSIYLSKEALVALCTTGTSIITLSELQSRYPEAYGDLTLNEGECAVFVNNAGEIYRHRIGQSYHLGSGEYLTIVDVFDDPNVISAIVARDEVVDFVITNSIGRDVMLYCEDKASVRSALDHVLRRKSLAELSPALEALASEYPEKSNTEIIQFYLANATADIDPQLLSELQLQLCLQSELLAVTVKDPYGDTYRAYEDAAGLRADGRSIVVATLLVLSLVMLYFLCRAQVNGRTELLAVYRLLGIPRRKLYAIFAMEALLGTMRTVLPATIVTCLGVYVATAIPELELSLTLPWAVAGAVSGAILVYYLAVSTIPLARPLKLPPARLAAKYDM